MMKKQYSKLWILGADLLVVPAMLLCRWLTTQMLATEKVCIWVRLGGQCITCGGTHFVNDLTSLRIMDAFWDNQFLFVLAVYFAVTWVLLNLHLLFRITFAKKMLMRMYSIPAVIAWCVAMFVFIFWRNWEPALHIIQLLL